MSSVYLLNNRYQLEERLGSGGMATVFRATDRMLERTVAIKLLRKDFSWDEEFRERFRQEAKAAANLSHPNIVTVHDFGYDDERLFIIMEFIPGTNLKTILKRRGRYGVEEALALMVQACAGIGYAHRAGLVHCDIKPQNLLITPDQRLKVVDFGIARAMASILPEEKADIVWGSPQYFSPEQATGSPPSPASDVYSLGIVLFEMLTNQLPFTAETPEELARKHQLAPVPSPRKFNPAIPIPVEQVILKVLSKEPSARYRTADQLGRVLMSLGQSSPARHENGALDTQAAPTVFSQPAVKPVRVANPSLSPILPLKPVHAPGTSIPAASPASIRPKAEKKDPTAVDLITWLLGLLALIAVGGLIPFWLWVYYVLKPPL